MSTPETTQPAPVQLVIDTNSWHYSYFKSLRRYYGMRTSESHVTSLCPYVQTMIWGSVVFVLSLPLQILGWLFLKMCRMTYRCCEVSGLTVLVDTIDGTPAGRALDRSPERLEENPFITTMMWAFALIMFAGSFAIVGFVLVFGVWKLILSIPYWPAALWTAITWVGWVIVWAGWLITEMVCGLAMFFWWLLCQIGSGVVWFFTTLWLWEAVLYGVGWLLLIVCGSFVLGGMAMWLGNNRHFKSVLTWLSMKMNGYQEAKTLAEKRRIRHADEVKETSDEERECKICAFLCNCANAVFDVIGATVQGVKSFFLSRDITVDGTTKRVMSPVALVGTFLWSAKKRLCPLVTFVDANNLGKTAKEGEE